LPERAGEGGERNALTERTDIADRARDADDRDDDAVAADRGRQQALQRREGGGCRLIVHAFSLADRGGGASRPVATAQAGWMSARPAPSRSTAEGPGR